MRARGKDGTEKRMEAQSVGGKNTSTFAAGLPYVHWTIRKGDMFTLIGE